MSRAAGYGGRRVAGFKAIGIVPYVEFTYEVGTGVSGGGTASTSAWTKFPINTEEHDANALASLASDVITLAQGIWEFEGWAAFMTGGASADHRTRLRDTTNSLTFPGGNSQAGGAATDSAALHMPIKGRFTLTAQANFEYQYFFDVADQLGYGTTIGSGSDNVIHRQIIFRRIDTVP